MMAAKRKSWQIADRIDGLMAIERELRSLLDQRLASKGLTYARLSLLRFIDAPKDRYDQPISSPVRPVDVAGHFKYAPRTVTEAINGLVKYGLVKSTRHPVDGRSRLLALTPKGKDALTEGQAVVQKTEHDIFLKLPRTQDEMLWFAVPRLRDNIASARKKDEYRLRHAK